jgi:hypothetical protein
MRFTCGVTGRLGSGRSVATAISATLDDDSDLAGDLEREETGDGEMLDSERSRASEERCWVAGLSLWCCAQAVT